MTENNTIQRLESALQQLLQHTVQVTNSEYAFIDYHWNNKPYHQSYGKNGDLKALSQDLTAQLSPVWEQGRSVHITQPPTHSAPILALPVYIQEQVAGVLGLGGADICGEHGKQQALLRELATMFGYAIDNNQMIQRLEKKKNRAEQQTLKLQQHESELAKLNRQLRDHEQELERRAEALEKANRQLKSHELELELLNEELMFANTAKDQFLANTSHELRTPLNAIIGFSELLADKRLGTLNPKQQRYAVHIQNSGQRLLRIINDLLDISKIEAGMMDIYESLFDPVELAQQVIAELQPLANSKQITLTIQHQLPSMNIQSDKDKFHQVLINLLGNSIKFTPDHGKVELKLTLQQYADHSSNEKILCCTVCDNGIGISKADQEKIFSPFTQADGAMDRTHGGTGLGLTLSRHITQLLGGDITLKSELNQGSEFTINIPVICFAAEATEHTITVTNRQHTLPIIEEIPPEEVPNPLIFIVDENHERATTARKIFASEGYDVCHCNIQEIERRATETPPFLIVLGIPDNSKIIHNCIHQLKQAPTTHNIPTILMAGQDDNPSFNMISAIGQVDNNLNRKELLDMVYRYGMQISQAPRSPMVLIIDDDPTVREYLKDILTPVGYRVLLASNGNDGLRLAVDREPDLIILDLMMPRVSGFQVIDKLRSHPSACDIPVIIFTAKDLTRSEALLLGQDVERVLIKGVSKRQDVLTQLHKLELLYPARAKLIDVKLDCFNLRYIQRRLDHEFSRTLRYDHHFAAIVWELDQLNAYYQQHGNRWGDTAIKASIATVNGTIRKADVLARLDHNRFLLLLPGISSLSGTYHVAEKIRLRINHQRLPLPNNLTGKISASLGIALSKEMQDADSLLKLLNHRLDQALYEGGNCIEMGNK